MVYEFLKAFFPDDTLVYKEVVFDLADEDDAEIHKQKMKELAEYLSKYVFIHLAIVLDC
jgi:hypothetical protein